MRLKLDGQDLMVHFHHYHRHTMPRQNDPTRWAHQTTVSVHRGPCGSREPKQACPVVVAFLRQTNPALVGAKRFGVDPSVIPAGPVTLKPPSPIGIGVARCSKKDPFDKQKGRTLALSRALASMGMSRGERTSVWVQYHEQMALATTRRALALVAEARKVLAETAKAQTP